MTGSHKLLRPYPEQPIVRRSVQVALASGVGPVGVVVDPKWSDVVDVVAELPVTLVECPNAAEGAARSARCAGVWAFAHAEVLILTLGDEPDLRAATIVSLFDHWRLHSAPAMRVRYRDRPGHPVLITRDFFTTSRQAGDEGFGRELKKLEAPELQVEADAPTDIDTEEDYQAALARLAH